MTFVIIYIYLSAVWNLTWINCWRLAWQRLRVPQTELESVAGEKEAWNCAKPAVTDENGWMDDSALVLKTKCVLHELMKIICFSSFQGFVLKNTIDVDFIVRLGNVSSPNINIRGYYFSSIIWFIQVCRGKKKVTPHLGLFRRFRSFIFRDVPQVCILLLQQFSCVYIHKEGRFPRSQNKKRPVTWWDWIRLNFTDVRKQRNMGHANEDDAESKTTRRN